MAGAAKSGIGKAARGIATSPVAEPYTPPSNMSVNLKEHEDMDGSADVGDKVQFVGHGKVTSIHKDEMGHRMSIDIHKISPDVASARG